MRKARVLRGGNFSEVSYGRVSGDKSAGRFFVFIQKNIDKCLRVLYFFVNLLPMRRILPIIVELLSASVANCLCYFTNQSMVCTPFCALNPWSACPLTSMKGLLTISGR